MSIITHKFRTSNANNFKEDFDLSDYYVFASSVNPSLTVNSEISANEFLENTLFGKKVDPNDVFFMIDNTRWQYETVYDQYDDKVDLLDKKFYAIVYPSDNSTGDYRVYKCLYNNHGAPSLNAPNYDPDTDDQIYRMGDGYIWKYMYSISEIEYQKYAALKYAPVIYKSATISNVIGTGNFVTFFGQNDFSIGMIATVRDVEPSQFNITGRTIVTANSSTFTVAGNETGTYITSTGIGYVQNDPINGKSIDHIEVENYEVNKGYELKQGTIEQVFTNNIVITSTVGEFEQLQDYYAGQNFYVTNSQGDASELYTINTYNYNIAKKEATITLLDKDTFIEENFTFKIFPRIEIKGDGSGAVAIPEINTLGTIESVLILNKGSGYTKATARIVTPLYGFDSTGTLSADIEAILRPILSPEGGHGYNYETELLSRRVLVYTQLTDTDNLHIPSSNQYTKIGLVKNPEFVSNNELLFDNRIELTLNSNILTVDEIVTQSSNNETTFSAKVHEVTDTNTVYLSNYHGPYKTSGTGSDAAGYQYSDIPINTLRKIISSQNQLLDINNITRPPYVQKTGEVYYMTSFAPITRTITSNEEYKIILEF